MYMSTHIYIPSLHIFVYAHMFAHTQLHYVQVGILNIMPGCGHQSGIYSICSCAHNATTHAQESNSAGDIQLKNVQTTSAHNLVKYIEKWWHLPETLQLYFFPLFLHIYLLCPHCSVHYLKGHIEGVIFDLFVSVF